MKGMKRFSSGKTVKELKPAKIDTDGGKYPYGYVKCAVCGRMTDSLIVRDKSHEPPDFTWECECKAGAKLVWKPTPEQLKELEDAGLM
jgi:hypothetical protein